MVLRRSGRLELRPSKFSSSEASSRLVEADDDRHCGGSYGHVSQSICAGGITASMDVRPV